ncbi:MAG: hypothetical protein PHS46_03790 [Candidatus Omnitrophica bacterium]|nr:hypothetical protein [Candidatus Omnitrophota bacterium]
MITKIISLVVASAFLLNSVAYGLGTMPGTTQPAVQDEMINMLRDGLLKKGPSALRDALSSETIHAEFSPSVEPAANGIRLLDGVPAGMESDPAFNAENLAEAIEKVLPGDVVSVDNYRADNPGDFPVAKMSRDGDRKKWTVHEYMASAWENIKSRDVIFTYTYQDGHAEAFSLASLLLDEVTSLGKRPHDDGRTGIVRDAVRAWFVGSYCLSNETRYNNDKLEERVRWFCRDAKAAEMGFLKAFPYMAETDETLARGVELVRFINRCFYAPDKQVAQSDAEQAGTDQSNATETIPSEVKQKIASVMFTHVKYTPDWDENIHGQIADSGLTAESFIASNPTELEKLITSACERYIKLSVERVSKACKSDVLMVTEFADVREVIAGAQELLWEKFLEELTGDTAIIKMPGVFAQNEEMRRQLNELVRPAFYSVVAEAFKKFGLSMPSQAQPRDPKTGRFETKLPGSPAMVLLLFAYCGKLDDKITAKTHRRIADDFSGFVNISDRTLRRDREVLREAGYLIDIIDSDADQIESDVSPVTYKLSASGKKAAKALLNRLRKKYGPVVRYAIFDEFSSGNKQIREDIKKMDAKIKKKIVEEKLRAAAYVTLIRIKNSEDLHDYARRGLLTVTDFMEELEFPDMDRNTISDHFDELRERKEIEYSDYLKDGERCYGYCNDKRFRGAGVRYVWGQYYRTPSMTVPEAISGDQPVTNTVLNTAVNDVTPRDFGRHFMSDAPRTPEDRSKRPGVPGLDSEIASLEQRSPTDTAENATIMLRRTAAMEEFKNYPFITDINTVEFALPIAPEVGPSSDTKDFRLSREQILNIWKTVNLAHEERVKILLLQDEVGPTGTTMDAALHDIRNRIRNAGGNDDTIDFELFQGEDNLETLLDPNKDESSKRVKRIVLTVGSRSRGMVSNLVDRRPELFKKARSLGIELPVDYYDFKPNSKERTFYQASMLLRGWNAAIIDNTKRTTAASILFTNMLKGCYDGDIGVLLKQLVPVENETDKETKERINSCSNSAIRLLSQKTAAAIENLKLIMREFWTAA